MLSTIHSPAISNITGGRKSKNRKGALQVNLGPPFHLLTEIDSDAETPSPLTISFDFPKPKSFPLKTHIITVWSDSDSDSDSDSEPPIDDSQYIVIPSDSPFYSPPTPPTFQTVFDLLPVDNSQYISISSDSPFYSPPAPPTFQTAFDLPPVGFMPFACQALGDADRTAAELFHAELDRILPEEVKKELFLVDEQCLKGMDRELFSAPMDAFMDASLPRLHPASSSMPLTGHERCPDVPEDSNEQESVDSAALAPTYYLASFLDLRRQSVASLPPNLRGLFAQRAISTDKQPAIPAAVQQITPFL
ncbi:hypothetical protein C8R43DRAFT_644918 [Mycena crocata]|nr:hypothetical protein C8R43DRAFT_644918 [Mycena crocata]